MGFSTQEKQILVGRPRGKKTHINLARHDVEGRQLAGSGPRLLLEAASPIQAPMDEMGGLLAEVRAINGPRLLGKGVL